MFRFLSNNTNTTTKRFLRHETYAPLVRSELMRVTEYYRGKNYPSQTTVFSRTISKLTQSDTLTDIDYLTRVEQELDSVVRIMGFTTTYSKGNPITNHMINCNHLIVTVRNTDAIDLIGRDWKDLTPLKPIGTTNADVSMQHPTDMIPIDVLTTELDITTMMYMFYKWGIEQRFNNRAADARTFIYQYVYTNMIPGLVDLGLMYSALYKRELIFKQTHPFHIRDVKRYYDDILEDYHKFIKKRRLFYSEVISNIPTITRKPFDYIPTKTISNRQTMWVDTLLLFPIIYRVIKVSGKKYIPMNRRAFSEINLFMHRYKGNNSYALPEMANYNKYFEYITNQLVEDTK